MRIHKLVLTNITSLRGTHVIDFEEALGGENLFAITGPTGSGKSSLLTALGLALYGKTHKGLNQEDYVSQGAAEGYIELVFSVAGKRYQAVWNCSVRNKKTGELKKKATYGRDLIHDGQSLGTTAAENILGLSFDQFCKTVILNQGEFDKFLKSSFTDRKIILERLYNGEHLQLLSKMLKSKIKEIGLELEKLQEKSENVLFYKQEEVDESLRQVEVLDQLIKNHKAEKAHLFPVKEKLEELLDLGRQQKDIVTRQKTYSESIVLVKKQIAEQKIVFDKTEKTYLECQNNLKEQTPVLNHAVKISERLFISEKTFNEQKERIKRLTESKKQKESDLTKTQDEIKSTKLRIKDIRANYHGPNEDKWPEFKDAAEELLSRRREQELIKNGLDSATPRLVKLEEKGKNSTLELEQLKRDRNLLLSHSDLNNENFAQQLEFKRTELKITRSTLQTAISKIETAIRDNSVVINEMNAKKEKMEEHNKTLSNYELQLIDKQKLKELAEINRETARLTSSIRETIKHTLISNTCATCDNDIDEIKKNVLISKLEHLEKVAQESPDFDVINEEFSSLSSKIELERKILQAHKDDLDKYRKRLVDQNEQLKYFLSLNELPNDMEVLLSDRKNELTAIDAQENDLQKTSDEMLKLNAKESHLVSTLENDREEYKRLRTEVNKKAEECSIIDKKIQILIDTISHIVPSYNLNLETFEKEYKSDRDSHYQLNKLEESLKGFEKENELLSKNLMAQQSEINELNDLISTSAEEINNLNAELFAVCPDKNPEELLNALTCQLDAAKDAFEKEEKLIRSLERERDNSQSAFGLLEDQYKSLINTAIAALGELKSNTRNYCLNSCEIDDDFERQKRCRDGLNKISSVDHEEELFSNNREINFLYEDIFMPWYSHLEQQISPLEKNLVTHQMVVSNHAEMKKRQADLEKEITIAKGLLYRWQNLGEVLGKDEFRNFALSLIEEQLVAQANLELSHLCDGRYELTQRDRNGKQDFYIIDHWSSGLERKVETLSGGETFLVSLGLALSLAEMTRGHAIVDSFFIDEGFGSLDEDALDEVLEVLMNIRSRGKQIGFISHIKALTDRIDVRINLEKSKLGHSQITIQHF